MAGKGLRNMASIFIGPGGLRAGWRFLLFVLGIELAEFYLREPLLSLLSRRSGVNLDELSAPALFIEELLGPVSFARRCRFRPSANGCNDLRLYAAIIPSESVHRHEIASRKTQESNHTDFPDWPVQK